MRETSPAARVKTWTAKGIRSVAPRTVSNLEKLSRLDAEFEAGGSRLLVFERELRELRREVDALRREHRRVVELYDAVFDYVRTNQRPESNPAPSDASSE